MILCEFTTTNGLQRISIGDRALEYQWFSYIQSFSSFKLATESEYGGYVKPSFTDLTLSPEMFKDNWPPPETATVKLTETETTEVAGTVIYEGSAYRSDFDRDTVSYVITRVESDAEVPEDTVLSGTFKSVLTTLCSTYIGFTPDFTGCRSSVPNVNYEVTSSALAIDLLSDICAFFTHGFIIEDNVVYFQDMLIAVVTVPLTEFDVFPCSYSSGDIISLVTCGDYSVSGSNTSGDEVSVSTAYTDVQADIEDALINILTVLESQNATINCPIDATKPGILDTVTLNDESLVNSITSSIKVTSVVYNFDSNKMQMEGFGEVS